MGLGDVELGCGRRVALGRASESEYCYAPHMADEPDIPQMVQMMRRLYRRQAASMVRQRVEEAQATHGKAEEAAFWRKVAEALAAADQAGDAPPDKPADSAKE
jgi:hypothetical protein